LTLLARSETVLPLAAGFALLPQRRVARFELTDPAAVELTLDAAAEDDADEARSVQQNTSLVQTRRAAQ
jgi:hypothetical protein